MYCFQPFWNPRGSRSIMKSSFIPLCLLVALVALVSASKVRRPTPTPCKNGKNLVPVGSSINRGCHKCTCLWHGQFVCLPQNCRGCIVQKRRYNHAQRFLVGCNTCTCYYGKATCTKLKCCRNSKRWLSPGAKYQRGCEDCTCLNTGQISCTRVRCQPCVIGKDNTDQRYNHGQSYKERCNVCQCNSGQVSCSKNNCCRNGNAWLAPGAQYRKGCSDCTCMSNGRISCTNVRCEKSCRRGETTYNHGQPFKDRCNYCKCNNGEVTCGNLNCCRNGNTWLVTGVTFKRGCEDCTCKANGQILCTNRRCQSCTVGKTTVAVGKSIRRDCQSCTCLANGQFSCRDVNCPCSYNGKTIQHGGRLSKGCATCHCYNRKVSCVQRSRGCCQYKDKWYAIGHKMSYYCNTCTCAPGKNGAPAWGCTRMYCFPGYKALHG